MNIVKVNFWLTPLSAFPLIRLRNIRTLFFAILANIITLSGWKISRQIVVFPADFLFFPLFYYIKNRDEKLG